jgi:hypothetical protein
MKREERFKPMTYNLTGFHPKQTMKTELTQHQKDALFLAQTYGTVFAGRNNAPRELPMEVRARMQDVHHSAITALVKRGLLVACRSPDGGYAGKPAPVIA